MQSLVQYVLKFVAILRDSLQETLDSKVLYAMFALSGLIILAVASISFEPKPAAKGVEAILDRFPFAKRIPFSRQEPPLRYELQDFVQTNDKEPWEKRKEAYIDRLRGEPVDVRLISVADKLYNARSIQEDSRAIGPEVWRRFKRGRDLQIWYFDTILEVFKSAGKSRIVDEFERVVVELKRITANDAA